jgi:hypothetical protein
MFKKCILHVLDSGSVNMCSMTLYYLSLIAEFESAQKVKATSSHDLA